MRDGVTGRDVIRAVRAAVGGNLPRIIVTGDTAPERLRDASEVDAVFLHKPLPAAQLRAALSACSARSSMIVGDR